MQVRLRDVADVMVVPIPDGIKREAASRRIDITCNVTPGRDLGSVAVEVDEKVRGLSHEPRVTGTTTAWPAGGGA